MNVKLLMAIAPVIISVAFGQSKREWELRDSWQKPEEIVQALDIGQGDWVGDIGSGDGYFVRYLLEATGSSGRVFAVDIDEDVLGSLRSRFGEKHPELTVVLGETDDPKLPQSKLDGAVILQSYHEMTAYKAMLERILDALKVGGRLVIVDAISESRETLPRSEQTEKHEISSNRVLLELEETGFEILSVEENFVKPRYHDRMWIIVSRKP